MSFVVNSKTVYDSLYQKNYYKDEVHDGKLVFMAPSPSVSHNQGFVNLISTLNIHFSDKKSRVFGELDVFLTEKNRFRPDIIVVCDPSIIKPNGIYGAPDLVCEILSPSTAKYDRGYKKKIYAAHGVKEYWLVDTTNLTVEVYIQQDSNLELYNTHTILPELPKEYAEILEEHQIAEYYLTTFKTPLFEDLELDLKDIFKNII